MLLQQVTATPHLKGFFMKAADLDKRVTVVEVQLEERWKETILRIKRIEAILIGSAGTMIVLFATMLWRM